MDVKFERITNPDYKRMISVLDKHIKKAGKGISPYDLIRGEVLIHKGGAEVVLFFKSNRKLNLNIAKSEILVWQEAIAAKLWHNENITNFETYETQFDPMMEYLEEKHENK
jgi:hypothetical protein